MKHNKAFSQIVPISRGGLAFTAVWRNSASGGSDGIPSVTRGPFGAVRLCQRIDMRAD